MELSITTDYLSSKLSPELYLRQIADAGFTHIQWCHHWSSDFLYSKWEINQVKKWLMDFGLKLVDLHSSAGIEKSWGSLREYERLAGVELVKNRIHMAASLGTDIINLHIPKEPESENEKKLFQTNLRKSLNQLEPFAKEHNIRIALENLVGQNPATHQQLFCEYNSSFLGLCFDSGHDNIDCSGFELLDSHKDSLLSLHLNDNDGVNGKQHNLLFSGTVNWSRVARAIAGSSYTKCPSIEAKMDHSKFQSQEEFLAKAFETGTVFAKILSQERNRINAR
jgi:sugar phosphate isomerase/epimerase